MAWFILSQIFSTVLTLLRLGRTSDKDKDLEILILRQQLGIVQRHLDKSIKPNRAEKLTLAVLSTNLKKQTNRLSWLMLTAVFDHDSLRPSPSQRRWSLDPISNYWIEFLNDTVYFAPI